MPVGRVLGRVPVWGGGAPSQQRWPGPGQRPGPRREWRPVRAEMPVLECGSDRRPGFGLVLSLRRRDGFCPGFWWRAGLAGGDRVAAGAQRRAWTATRFSGTVAAPVQGEDPPLAADPHHHPPDRRPDHPSPQVPPTPAGRSARLPRSSRRAGHRTSLECIPASPRPDPGPRPGAPSPKRPLATRRPASGSPGRIPTLVTARDRPPPARRARRVIHRSTGTAPDGRGFCHPRGHG